MEKKALLIALLSAIGISTFAIERPAFAQTPPDYSTSSEPIDDTDPRALSTFEPALDPYGSWVDDDQYGQVWIPDPYVVGSDFVPYVSAGHWA